MTALIDPLDLLDADDPAAALRAVSDDHPDAWWLRALCAAHLGDALRASIAVRRVAAPPSAEVHLRLAHGLAHAALTETDTLPAWRVATAPLAAPSPDGLPGDLALAWQVLVPATDHTAPSTGPRAACVLRLAALADRLGRDTDADMLTRSAQEDARRAGAWPTFAAASRLAARRAHTAGDPDLADAILRHAARLLRDAAAPESLLREPGPAW